MTRCSAVTDGKLTRGLCAFSELKPFPVHRIRIPTLSDSLERFLVNILSTSASGMFPPLN
jgi:hypothetical protein